MELSKAMAKLLAKHRIVMVASASKNGKPNASMKGIVEVIPEEGVIYFLDLYSQKTKKNLLENPQVSISFADIEDFVGYQFKGTVEIIEDREIVNKYVDKWEKQRTVLLIERMIKNVQKGSSHGRHEMYLPDPKYLVKVKVTEIYDLLPQEQGKSKKSKKK
ncbi:MAG: pyridoxamine 5'-phosphate oxidase family protein [Candidatus Omnitrophica bacterium]|nr:pyridoxamine 5'-phosphate oxidase family protein [Candidatus Omnitrophota bacterium]